MHVSLREDLLELDGSVTKSLWLITSSVVLFVILLIMPLLIGFVLIFNNFTTLVGHVNVVVLLSFLFSCKAGIKPLFLSFNKTSFNLPNLE